MRLDIELTREEADLVIAAIERGEFEEFGTLTAEWREKAQDAAKGGTAEETSPLNEQIGLARPKAKNRWDLLARMVEDSAPGAEVRQLRDELSSTKPPAFNLKAGDLFLGQYRIMEELAAGCRGAVYQADDVQMNTSVLIVLMLSGETAREATKPDPSNTSLLPEPRKPLLRVGMAGDLVFHIFELIEISLIADIPQKAAIRLMRWLDDPAVPLLSSTELQELLYCWLLQEDRPFI